MKHSIIIFVLLIVSLHLYPTVSYAISYAPATYVEQAPSLPSISVKTIDALTAENIKNATIILWDVNNFVMYKYFTDENGKCVISGDPVKIRNTYWLYVFKGDLNAKIIDYVPVKATIYFEKAESVDITLKLIPGALVEIEGIPYIVQSSSLEKRRMLVKVMVEGVESLSFINEYGSSVDAFFMGLPDNIVIVPAGFPFFLRVEVAYLQRRLLYFFVEREIFHIRNGSFSFVMSRGSPPLKIKIPVYSLRRGIEYTRAAFAEISRIIDEAQSIGFTVFEERKILSRISQNIVESESLLQNAQTDEDFEKIWLILRRSLDEMDNIRRIIGEKMFFAESQAVYLPAVISVFSITVAFFFFEDDRKKILSNPIFYIAFLIILYYTHPGTHIIIGRNFSRFIYAAAISFAAFSILVFAIPRVWKERTVEGEVSWRSAITVIFSMGKRQIKRKKLRNFFTIFSVGILILAFVSLTSFGTVFGVVSEVVGSSRSSDCILVKRMINGSSALFSPLGYSDIVTISDMLPMTNVGQRWKNFPQVNPIAVLTNPKTNAGHLIYGVIAISPNAESLYTELRNIISTGEYLSEDAYGEILISSSVASKIGVRVKSNITLNLPDANFADSFIVKGIIDDERYNALRDVDGSLFGPYRLLEGGALRRCNSTEIIIINLKTAEKLSEKAPKFILFSEIIFQPASFAGVESNVKNLVLTFGYDIFVSLGGVVTYYHIGSYVEFKGIVELLIPIVMVVLNVSMVMINSAYEREKEIRVLSTVGLNPTHIGLTFVAEATVIGMVGGSLGYLAGLSFYRIMTLFGHDLMVREKLEWWWSALGFALAITISVLSAMRPAAMAVSAYTPSRMKRVKRAEKEMEKRKEEIFKVYQARDLSMPVKVLTNEKEFFVGYLLNYLNELRFGYVERIENIEELPETESTKGEITKTIKFVYLFGPHESRRGTNNTLILTKRRDEEYYRVRLITEPVSPGMPESVMDRTVSFIHEIIMRWVREKKRIVGAA